jgi:hypothetical protein
MISSLEMENPFTWYVLINHFKNILWTPTFLSTRLITSKNVAELID